MDIFFFVTNMVAWLPVRTEGTGGAEISQANMVTIKGMDGGERKNKLFKNTDDVTDKNDVIVDGYLSFAS